MTVYLLRHARRSDAAKYTRGGSATRRDFQSRRDIESRWRLPSYLVSPAGVRGLPEAAQAALSTVQRGWPRRRASHPDRRDESEHTEELGAMMSADFSRLLTHLAENLKQHADRDGLTGARRAVFLARGGHAPGTTCPTEPATIPDPHQYWCASPDDECNCPAGSR
jgi:hypothetical protein